MEGARKSPADPKRDGTITAPGMPNAVRVHGKIILIWNTIALVLALVLIVLGLAHGDKYEIIQGAVQGIVAFLFFKFGQGLIAARKRAVLGLTMLCAAGLMVAFIFHEQEFLTPFGGVRLVILVPALVVVLYLRPLLSAFRNWRRFR
jgi:hypothetical protein